MRYCGVPNQHKLEGHSVEGIYLRQRSSDGSVNKTILKPRQYVYVGLSDVKFRVAAQLAGSLGKAAKFCSLYTISEKAILFRHPDYYPDRAQKLISSSMSRHLSTRTFQHFIQIRARVFE